MMRRLLINESSGSQHYNLKRMAALIQLIPELFKNRSLRDFWISEYLIDHIEENGISNSTDFIRAYVASCRTRQCRNRIKTVHMAELQQQEDHTVKTYKEVNGFILEAHIFKPAGLMKKERRPVIVIFHGGGWGSGKASWAFGRARHFQESGLIAVAAQYRLTNKKDITAFESMADGRD